MAKHVDILTGDLFADIPRPAPRHPGSMDYRAEVAALVNQIIADYARKKGKPFDVNPRYEIAAKMSELGVADTSKSLLDSYTAMSRDDCNIPLWKAPLIECVTEARALAEWHAAKLGGRILWGPEVLDAEIGRAQTEIARLQDQVRGFKDLRKRVRANG